MSGDSLRRSFLQSRRTVKPQKRRKNESGNEFSLLRVLCALKVDLILPARSFVPRRLLLHFLLLFFYSLLPAADCMASKCTRAVDDKKFCFQQVNSAWNSSRFYNYLIDRISYLSDSAGGSWTEKEKTCYFLYSVFMKSISMAVMCVRVYQWVPLLVGAAGC